MQPKHESQVLCSRRGAGMLHLLHTPEGKCRILFYECVLQLFQCLTARWSDRAFNNAKEARAFVFRQILSRNLPVGFDGYSGYGIKRFYSYELNPANP